MKHDTAHWSGRFALGVTIALIVMVLILIAVALWVAAQSPPTNPFAGQG